MNPASPACSLLSSPPDDGPARLPNGGRDRGETGVWGRTIAGRQRRNVLGPASRLRFQVLQRRCITSSEHGALKYAGLSAPLQMVPDATRFHKTATRLPPTYACMRETDVYSTTAHPHTSYRQTQRRTGEVSKRSS